MFDALIYLIIMLVVGGVLWYCLQRAVAGFGIPRPVAVAIEVIALLLFVLMIVGVFFGGVDVGRPVWRN